MNGQPYRGRLRAPQLRRLELESGWVPTYSECLQYLKVTWKDEARTPRPSAYVLAKFLLEPNARSLVDIHLSDALFSPTDENDLLRQVGAPNYPELHLPCLRSIRLEGCALSFGPLLGAISCSPDTNVSISMSCQAFLDQEHVVPTVLRDLASRLRKFQHQSTNTKTNVVTATPVNRIQAVAVDIRRRQYDQCDIEVTGWVTPPAEACRDTYTPGGPTPLIFLAVAGVDTSEVQWHQCVDIISEAIGADSVRVCYFHVPRRAFRHGEVDWDKLFTRMPNVSAVRPREDIIEATPNHRLKARLRECRDI